MAATHQRETTTRTIEQEPDLLDQTPMADLLDQVLANTTRYKPIETAASVYFHALEKAEATFQRAMVLAEGIQKLRAMLTEDVMNLIMSLQNSQLGFLTDRSDKTPPGYPVEIVRECFIESLLRGLHPTNNEWNIISGKLYVAKNGVKRLVEEIPGIEILEDLPGTPYQHNGQTVVKYILKWRIGGEEHQLLDDKGQPGRVIPIRVNNNMIVDAVLGKATRKAYAVAYEKITRHKIPDGEIAEGELDQAMERAKVIANAPAPGRTRVPTKPAPQPQAEEKPTNGTHAEQPDEAEQRFIAFGEAWEEAENTGELETMEAVLERFEDLKGHPTYGQAYREKVSVCEGHREPEPPAPEQPKPRQRRAF